MEQVKRRCPKCKGVRFNVLVEASQRYNSKSDEWDNVEIIEVRDVKNAYLCLDCSSEFRDLKDLEKY